MRNRSNPADSNAAAAPACWQREGPSACLRVELPNGETHLFAYQHFVTAVFTATMREPKRRVLSSRRTPSKWKAAPSANCCSGYQEFAVKWIWSTPERYQALPAGSDGTITGIRIVAVE